MAAAGDPVARVAPRLIPVLTFGQEAVLRLVVAWWALASAWFWLWWLADERGAWTAGRVALTAVLAWVFLIGAYFFFFACRMTRPDPATPLPRLRVAMVVTKAPSEPWPVVQRTLEAMLDQRMPYPYDVWLADEKPSGAAWRWCLEHGVGVSTRFHRADYHQPQWPRRTRCKEGNLAWFYDSVGYDRYDVVAQLDADHVPAPDYLEHVVRPFADPAVGYVAAPSVCDANAQEGWTVRGRLHREASLHGPVQAGSNGGWAPLCIGSHYAVRTSALREIGGLGPELAEDYSTTLLMQAGGWGGVFALDAEAHGDGPESFDEMMTQELQWSRSLGTVLVRWAPGRFRRLRLRARARMGFALAFYPIQGLQVVAASALTMYCLVTRSALANVAFADFYLRIWPGSLATLVALAYLRRRSILRPPDAQLWSWELALFQVVRLPWTTWGYVHGMWSGRRGVERRFAVTPKGEREQKPLSTRFLLPSLVAGAVPAIAVAAVGVDDRNIGFAIVAALQSVLQLVAVAAVVVLHVAGNRRRAQRAGEPYVLTAAGGGRATVVVGATAVPALLLLAWSLWRHVAA